MFLEKLEKELNKYSWGYKFTINEHNPFYDIIFPNVVITFYRNLQYRSVECTFEVRNHKEYKSNLETLLKADKVDTSNLYYEYSSVEEESYLKQYIQIIFLKLLHIINGNYENFEIINKFNNDFNLIVKTLGTSLIFDTEIYRKLERGDESWREDLINMNPSDS